MPVQVLERGPSLGALFGTGLGAGLGQGLQALAQHKMGQFAQRQQAQRTQQGLQALGIAPQEAEQISQLPQELQRTVVQNYLQGAERAGLAEALGALEAPPGAPGLPTPVAPEAVAPTVPPGIGVQPPVPAIPPEKLKVSDVLRKPRLTPQHQLKIAEMRQKRSRFEQKLRTERRKELLQDQRESNKETLDYYKQTNKLAKGAKEGDLRLARMEVLNEKGKMGLPIFNTAIKAISKGIFGLGLDLTHLMAADAQEFDKLSTDFLKNVKDIFGARITDREVALFLKTVPSLAQSKTGRSRIIRNLRLFNDAAKLRQKSMTEIIKANKGNRPRNIESLVEEMVGPQLYALSEEFSGGEVGAAPFHEAFYD